jgi:hypothetical protein
MIVSTGPACSWLLEIEKFRLSIDLMLQMQCVAQMQTPWFPGQ